MGMLTLLRKTFIRDYDQIASPEVRAKHGVFSSILGLFLNAILVTLKLLSAILLALGNSGLLSMALLGDALNNLFDFASSIIALIGFKLSRKPADKDHPYGHGRAEYIAGILIGVAIVASAVILIYRSIQGIIKNEAVSYDVLAYIVLALTLPIKGLQFYVNHGFGKLLHSPALIAVSRDSLSDIVLSSLLLLFALLSHAFSWGSLDNYLGIFVSLFLFYNGFKAFKEASDPLLGAPIDVELQEQIEAIAKTDPRVLGIHDFIVHSYGESVRYISFHAELNEELSLKDAHDIIDALEEKIEEQTLAHVVIHPDPVSHNHELEELKSRVALLLQEVDGRLDFHDAHLQDNNGIKTLHIDVLLPFDAEPSLSEKVSESLSKLGFPTKVTFDHPFHN